MGFRKMLRGFRDFQHEHFNKDRELYDRLVNQGQSPKVMVIACSDSRIDPAVITKSEPGDIFSVRNIAAMVSSNDDSDKHGYASTAAAVEYAVKVLKVDHIIVLGHALCGGVHALAESGPDLDQDNSFIARWISIGADARNKVRAVFPFKAVKEQAQILEKASILVSVNNLMTFPWVREAVELGNLKIHGWYFDMPNGALLNYNPAANDFENVLDKSVSAAMSHASIEDDNHISITAYLHHLSEHSHTEKKSHHHVGSQDGVVKKTGAKIKQATQSVSLALSNSAVLESEITKIAMDAL